MALSGAGVTKVGNWWDRAVEQGKEKERKLTKGGAFSSKRVGGGRRKEDDAQARLLQLRSLASYVLLQNILQYEARNALPGASQQAPLTNAYRAPWRPPTLTCQPPRVAEIIGRGRGGNKGGALPPTVS